MRRFEDPFCGQTVGPLDRWVRPQKDNLVESQQSPIKIEKNMENY